MKTAHILRAASALAVAILMLAGVGCGSGPADEAASDASSTAEAPQRFMNAAAGDPGYKRVHEPQACTHPCDSAHREICYDSLELVHGIKEAEKALYDQRKDGAPFVFKVGKMQSAVAGTDCSHRFIMAIDSNVTSGIWRMTIYPTTESFSDPLARALPAMLIKAILRRAEQIGDFRFYWLKAPAQCQGDTCESVLMIADMKNGTEAYYDLSVPPDYVHIPAIKRRVDSLIRAGVKPAERETIK